MYIRCLKEERFKRKLNHSISPPKFSNPGYFSARNYQNAAPKKLFDETNKDRTKITKNKPPLNPKQVLKQQLFQKVLLHSRNLTNPDSNLFLNFSSLNSSSSSCENLKIESPLNLRNDRTNSLVQKAIQLHQSLKKKNTLQNRMKFSVNSNKSENLRQENIQKNKKYKNIPSNSNVPFVNKRILKKSSLNSVQHFIKEFNENKKFEPISTSFNRTKKELGKNTIKIQKKFKNLLSFKAFNLGFQDLQVRKQQNKLKDYEKKSMIKTLRIHSESNISKFKKKTNYSLNYFEKPKIERILRVPLSTGNRSLFRKENSIKLFSPQNQGVNDEKLKINENKGNRRIIETQRNNPKHNSNSFKGIVNYKNTKTTPQIHEIMTKYCKKCLKISQFVIANNITNKTILK